MFPVAVSFRSYLLLGYDGYKATGMALEEPFERKARESFSAWISLILSLLFNMQDTSCRDKIISGVIQYAGFY